jgi:putative spermidine/putrescine transport system permease protein
MSRMNVEPQTWRTRIPDFNRWALLLILPVAFLVAVFAYPISTILVRSITDFSPPYSSRFDNYRWFFETDVNVAVLQRTFAVAVIVTLVCLCLGYPYAYFMTIASSRLRLIMLGIVVVSFFTSFVVRNYAWVILLQDQGPINDMLSAVGFGRVEMLGNVKGVVIGMGQILVPLMILPLYATMRGIDRRLLLAAEGLGARPLSAFLHVYMPLSVPGVLAGSLLVFVITLGFYVTPTLLGSPSNALLSQLIVTQVSPLLAWGRAGVMSVVLLAATFFVLWILARAVRGIIEVPEQQGGAPGLVESERRRPTATRIALGAASGLVAAWLIAPLLIIFPASLTAIQSFRFPPPSWSTMWYENFFSDSRWYGSFLTSLKIAALVTISSVILGTSAALGLVRGRFVGRTAVNALVLSPMIVPLVVIAVGTYAVFLDWRLVGTTLGFVLAHTVLALPFVIVTVAAGLRTFDRELEDAAAGLGANPVQVFRTVTLRLILPSVLIGALFAFMTSFDEVVVALFIASPLNRTLPVQMYSSITRQIDPTIAAASSLLLLLTMVLFLAALLLRRGQRHA